MLSKFLCTEDAEKALLLEIFTDAEINSPKHTASCSLKLNLQIEQNWEKQLFYIYCCLRFEALGRSLFEFFL